MLKCAFVWHFNQHITHRESSNALEAMLDTFDSTPVVADLSGTYIQGLPWESRETFERLKERVEKGNVELLLTCFGQQIMSYFPKSVDEMHIKAHAKALSRLGARTKGFWVPERVWKPPLARIVARHAEYTLLDMPSFVRGNGNKDPYVPYAFEGLTIFNIHDLPEWLDKGIETPEMLADSFVEKATDELEKYDDGDDRIAIFATDGEIFRLGTTAIDIRFDADKYMRRVLDGLEKRGIEVTTPSRSGMKPKESAFYPPGTYGWLEKACNGSYDNWMASEASKAFFNDQCDTYNKIRAIEKSVRTSSARQLIELAWRTFMSSQFEFGWDGCGQFETVWTAWLWGNEVWRNARSALGLAKAALLSENIGNDKRQNNDIKAVREVAHCFGAKRALFDGRLLAITRAGAIGVLLDLNEGESLTGYEYFRGTSDLLSYADGDDKIARRLIRQAGKQRTRRRLDIALAHIGRQRARHDANARRLLFDDNFADMRVKYVLRSRSLQSATYHTTLHTGIGVTKRISLNVGALTVDWSFESSHGELGIADFVTEGVLSPSTIGMMNDGPDRFEMTAKPLQFSAHDKQADHWVDLVFSRLEHALDAEQVHYGARFDATLRMGAPVRATLRFS